MWLDTLKDVLDIPQLFDWEQRLIGAVHAHRVLINDYVKPIAGERVLDIGCGTGASALHVPAETEYVGIDINEAYIARAKKKFGACKTFKVDDVTTMPISEDSFDRAFSFGVLHHIDDNGVRSLLSKITKLVKPRGIYVTLDPCLVPGQNPIARVLAEHDRGKFVRKVEQLEGVFAGFGSLKTDIRSDLLKIPFTAVICVLTV